MVVNNRRITVIIARAVRSVEQLGGWGTRNPSCIVYSINKLSKLMEDHVVGDKEPYE